MTTEITTTHQERYGEMVAELRTDVFGSHHNVIFVTPTQVEISLSDWYGRRTPDEALVGIDDIIALLTAAKAEIAKLKGKS